MYIVTRKIKYFIFQGKIIFRKKSKNDNYWLNFTPESANLIQHSNIYIYLIHTENIFIKIYDIFRFVNSLKTF